MLNFAKNGLDRLLGRTAPVEAKSLASPEEWLVELFGATPASSGVAVTPRAAMSCAPVRCAVQAIAEAVGQLPLHVYRRTEDGAKDRAKDHPAHRILHDEANEWTPATEFREQLTRDALLQGNGLAYINRVEGRPVELLRLDPEAITLAVDTVSGEPVYSRTETRNGRPVKTLIPRANVLHIRAPSLDSVAGVSPVKQAREAIGLALVMEQHAARLFGSGARPSGLLSFKGISTPEALARAKAAWEAAHGGSKSGGTAALPADVTWQAITLNSVDSQFLELRNFAVAEIARVFRVPPTLLMDFGRATWANSESMRRDFVDLTLRRWLSAWEGECRLKLFSADERESMFCEFLLDDFVKGDIGARMTAYSTAIAARFMSPNEVRALENRGPYEGGDKFENPNTTTGAAA